MRDLDRHTGAPAELGEDDIARTAELVKVLDQAVESVRAGRPVVVEVLVQRGYGKYAAQLVGGDDDREV